MFTEAIADGDIKRNAMLLVKARGAEAIDFAEGKLHEMENIGDNENRDYWRRMFSYINQYVREGW